MENYNNNPGSRRFSLFIPVLIILFFSSKILLATIPPGYYDPASGKTGATLKTALYNIIKGHTEKSYAYLWTAFYTTDERTDDPTKVWDMYSDIPGGTPPYLYTLGTDQCGTASQEGDCYSREHSFPVSYFGDTSPMNTDLFHIVPADQYVNGVYHSNYPYGEVNVPNATSLNGSKRGPCASPGYTGTVFEPRDEYKGDFARNYFYMATRYENLIASWETMNSLGDVIMDGTSYPCYETWFLNLLISWHIQDPVSQKEIDRNEAIYLIQENRNPFIDHPEYVAAVWTPGTPTAVTNAASSITISSATLNGIVNPSGYATNYYFQWGLTTSYGNSTTSTSAGSGTSNVNVSAPISGLASGTVYHFRVVAVNSNGTAYGNDLTLTTLTATLGVTPSNQNVTSAAGSTSFSVTSNSAWTANSNQAWCTVTPSGSGNGTITANYSANPNVSQRVANVTVTVAGLSPVVVTVTQAAASPTLSVTPSDRPVSSSSGNTTFSVTSNTSWTATSNQTWCTVTPSGSGNGTITANYEQNTTIIQRIANVTVTVTGLTPVVVTVTQAAGAPTLSVLPANQNVTSTAGSTAFTVSSNTSWTASSNQSWCTCTPSGSGNGSITADYSANLSYSGREASITVTVTGLTPVVVTVTQAGVTALPEPTNFPTNFSAYNIILQWTDAIGLIVPDGYLVRMSSTGFNNIAVPIDGVPVPDGLTDKNVAPGIQSAWFGNLTPNTTYYFKIFTYTGTGSSIDYKTDGSVPQIQRTTQP